MEEVMYEPFGAVNFQAGGQEKYLYEAKEADKTGLYYFGARYYEPSSQRFTQPDTIIQNIYDPQSLNRYAFERNNPVKNTDPTGNYIETGIDIAFIGLDIKDINDDPDNLWNYASLATDLIFTAIPGATGGRVFVKGTEKGIGFIKATDKIKDAGKAGSEVVKYTQNNFRKNLMQLTKQAPDASKEAHHVFPNALENNFKKAGIENIHDPRYGAWVDASTHRKWSKSYNDEWKKYFKDNPSASTDDVLKQGQEMAKKYKFKTNYQTTPTSYRIIINENGYETRLCNTCSVKSTSSTTTSSGSK